MTRKRLWALGALLLAGCTQVTFVVFPAWDVRLTDQSGSALENALFYAYAWSQPYSQLDDEVSYPSDAAGRISSAERLSSEVSSPFVLHGVSHHYLSFCVSTPGYWTLVGTLEGLEPGETLTLTLPLTAGESSAICDDFDAVRLSFGDRREDVEAQNAAFSSVHDVTTTPIQRVSHAPSKRNARF